MCGLAAGLVQVLANPYSQSPTIGASGAIAGIMGAYLIKFPRSQIDTLFCVHFLHALGGSRAVLSTFLDWDAVLEFAPSANGAIPAAAWPSSHTSAVSSPECC